MTKAKKENQLDLFTPIMGSVVPVKDQQDLMTYPFFSLSKRKRTTPISYDDGRVKVEVIGTEEVGIASIYDADILIFVASHLVDLRNRGHTPTKEVQMSRYDILEFLGKGKGGSEYNRLKESLDRLQSTSIKTTIIREDSRYKKMVRFSWINNYEVVEDKKTGIPYAIKFELNDWLFNGIMEGKILTLPRKYFRIEGGLERFLFKLCRKIIGNHNGELQMKIETVHGRSGLTRKPGAFKKMIERIVKEQSVPDYWIVLAQRASTGDWYVCGYSRKFVGSVQEAQSRVSFIALDRALIDNNRGT